MKVGRDYSWWVEYSYSYEVYDQEEQKWDEERDFHSARFDCTKKEIKQAVTDYIKQGVLDGEQYRNLNVYINDCYMTTTEEV